MAGFMIKVDEDGVTLLRGLADGVDDGADEIVSITENLLDDVQQYSALGPHKKSIETIVEMIQEETKNATSPTKVVAEKLRSKADDYQDWIDNDIFGTSGN